MSGFRIEKRRKGVCNPLMVVENSWKKEERLQEIMQQHEEIFQEPRALPPPRSRMT